MNHICYMFIMHYNGIENLGINLDSRYKYAVDEGKREITVTENPNYIEGLWPEGIASLAAIVGNNGAGKTSSLLYLIRALEEGNGDEEVAAIIIYKQGDTMYAYIPNGFHYGYSVIPNISEKWEQVSERPKVNMFYYTSYFRPYTMVHEPGEGELSGVYNASDSWRLIRDYLDYANVDTLMRTEPIGMHLDALIAQDNNRIIQLIHDEELRECLPKNVIPQYIIIKPNLSGYDRLIYEINLHNQKAKEIKRIDQLRYPFFELSKDGLLASIVAANLFSICVEMSVPLERVQLVVDKWETLYKERWNDVRGALVYMQNEFRSAHRQIYKLQEIVNFLYEVCDGVDDTHTLYIDAFDNKKKEAIRKIRNCFLEKVFLVAHSFDLTYSHTPYASTRLSSGEYDMLRFFSRLYDAVCVYPKRADNIKAPQLLLIDEAENSYHPEWQRMYISQLTQFVHALYLRKETASEFQIILTTHSPILLSDVPVMCTNYLYKDEKDNHVSILNDRHETFGANIFDLYRDSFFMNNGLVGEFAQQKIRKIQKDIEDGVMGADDIEKEINMIGDRGIRAYLQTMLDENNKRDMLAYYKSKVEELENKNNAKD